MPKLSYFAWVVIVDKENSEPVFPDNDAELLKAFPNTRRASRPPRMASATAAWQFDATYDGFPETDVEIYPAGVTREDAVRWWRKHQAEFAPQKIVNRFLITFVDGIKLSEEDGAVDSDLPSSPHAAKFSHPFDEDDWSGDFKSKDAKGDVSLLPKDWKAQIADLNLGDPVMNECSYLDSLKPQRDPERRTITWEAKTWRNSVEKVLELMGDLERPKLCIDTFELLRRLDESIDAPLFTLKKMYMRGRPEKPPGACVDALFPLPHWYHPGHPAYPSGHATVAFAAAYCLQLVDKSLTASLLEGAAHGVAERREIAGLHYPSDTAAGKVLARWIVDQLAANDEFKALMAAASEELAQRAALPAATGAAGQSATP